MRLEQLEYLLAVVQHGSLRRASENLHLSQPALSEAIGKLERELGVTLLDRRRSGARISTEGRALLGGVSDVLEAADRLRASAGDRHTATRVIRIGTVNAGTSALVAPAIREFQDSRPSTNVEVLDLQQREIQQNLAEGALDLGLVNMMQGDETPRSLVATVLVHGTPVVVLPTDHPLADHDVITADDMRAYTFIAMRSGYLMHRFAQRFFGSEPPRTTYSTDGAAVGKLMVAEGLGLTVLPDYSVIDDPLQRAGLIVQRPLADDRTRVSLVLLHRQTGQTSPAVRDLFETLLRHARAYAAA